MYHPQSPSDMYLQKLENRLVRLLNETDEIKAKIDSLEAKYKIEEENPDCIEDYRRSKEEEAEREFWKYGNHHSNIFDKEDDND